MCAEEALEEIAEQVGKKDWNFSLNPCDGNSNWSTPNRKEKPLYNNTLTCNCSYPNGQCHVVQMSLTVNRLSGPIPSFLGNITTLRYMSMESNMFSGTVPPQLGQLVNLENLILNTNNLTGELPPALANLTKLTEFRISSNNFTGKIPNFIPSWKQLQKLEIQASGLEGPIPSSISVLKNLTELLKFSPLGNMKGLQKLMLRGCNIFGSIPKYLAEMTELQILDLSFNKLEGIVLNLEGLTQIEFMYLTSNYLTGSIPDWIESRNNRYQTDISYNNFSKRSMPSSCRETLNLFRSFSERGKLEFDECLNSFPCLKDQYSLHINCGGGRTIIGDIVYEADEDLAGPSKFVPTRDNWGFSSTGDFWDRDRTTKNYIAQNVSMLGMNDSELYTRARLSPLSFTYYGRCLADGTYTVKLHFAEIVIRDNKSFHSLGRRIFDVYIQEKLELQDFNIVQAAQGVDKVVVREFKAVVRNKTLEIRFHWAGKDFEPSSDGKKKIFIAVGAVAFMIFLILALRGIKMGMMLCSVRFQGNHISGLELRGLDLQTGLFTLRQIKAATNSFDAANKIGEGGFGSVYKGTLLDGTIIAVKQLSTSQSKESSSGIPIKFGLVHEAEDLCWHSKRGYMAPEYALWGYLTYKADVYSFGVVALELVAGKNNMKYRPNEDCFCLLDWLLSLWRGRERRRERERERERWRERESRSNQLSSSVTNVRPLFYQQKGNLMELVDPKLGTEFKKDEAIRMIKVALLCTNPSPALRPTMSAVVSMLKGQTVIQEYPLNPSIYGDEFGFEALRGQYDQMQLQSSSDIEPLNHSSHTAQSGSSLTSSQDP
ncbi:putative LRR receptor-like serine/threonine-protein kinase [Vitis vinifera]|uniref:non-specific serine/threonine protein kinase n=1 Tax=Vitis vinifera TaxID=29760 RepID=A0A438H3Y0_VITVI|nr:putative LRR receptor-like serine/threonine-protein kinase [Vitis vinifera]